MRPEKQQLWTSVRADPTVRGWVAGAIAATGGLAVIVGVGVGLALGDLLVHVLAAAAGVALGLAIAALVTIGA